MMRCLPKGNRAALAGGAPRASTAPQGAAPRPTLPQRAGCPAAFARTHACPVRSLCMRSAPHARLPAAGAMQSWSAAPPASGPTGGGPGPSRWRARRVCSPTAPSPRCRRPTWPRARASRQARRCCCSRCGMAATGQPEAEAAQNREVALLGGALAVRCISSSLCSISSRRRRCCAAPCSTPSAPYHGRLVCLHLFLPCRFWITLTTPGASPRCCSRRCRVRSLLSTRCGNRRRRACCRSHVATAWHAAGVAAQAPLAAAACSTGGRGGQLAGRACA